MRGPRQPLDRASSRSSDTLESRRWLKWFNCANAAPMVQLLLHAVCIDCECTSQVLIASVLLVN